MSSPNYSARRTPGRQRVRAHGRLFAEVILTFFLIYVIFGSAVDQRSDKSIAALAFGLTITIDICAMGAVTGAAMNPVRHFGPALVEGLWTDWYVWWIAPIIVAVLAAIVYSWVLLQGRTGSRAEGPRSRATSRPGTAPATTAATAPLMRPCQMVHN